MTIAEQALSLQLTHFLVLTIIFSTLGMMSTAVPTSTSHHHIQYFFLHSIDVEALGYMVYGRQVLLWNRVELVIAHCKQSLLSKHSAAQTSIAHWRVGDKTTHICMLSQRLAVLLLGGS